MAPKRKPPPLHRSLQLIEEERINVAKRTQQRIAQLCAHETKSVDFNRLHEVEHAQWQCCVNNICFCVLLVIANLLFFQWVYIKTNVQVQLQLLSCAQGNE
jgi:hypothetical protein